MPLTGYTCENSKALHYNTAEGTVIFSIVSIFVNSLSPSFNKSIPTQQKLLSFLCRYWCNVSCRASSLCNGVLTDCASNDQTGKTLIAQDHDGTVGVVTLSTQILWSPQWHTHLCVARCSWASTNSNIFLEEKLWQRQAFSLLSVPIMQSKSTAVPEARIA